MYETEQVRVIRDFPQYAIGFNGTVFNRKTGLELQKSVTLQGALKVGMYIGDVQYTRSVKVLVAEAFVEGRTPTFNTPIQLDGDQMNVSADNLEWRPRWFAMTYTRQFKRLPDYHDHGPVIDLEDKVIYWDVMDAAVKNGLLLRDIWRSIHLGYSVFPLDHHFDIYREEEWS